MAYPLGVSEVLLVTLLLVIASLARSAPGIGWLIVAFLLMTAASLVGTYRYEDTRFGLWVKELKVKEVGEAISYSAEERTNKKRQGSHFAGILVWALDRIGVAISYLGLPILLALILSRPSFWVWGGCALCLVGFLTPPIYFRARRMSVFRGVKREYAKLKQAETSGNLQAIVAALDNPHISDISKVALRKQFRSNPSVVFDHLLRILVAGQGNWRFVHFLWWQVAKGVYDGGPYKLDPIFAKRLVEVLSEKSIPIEQRTDLLHDMIKDENFFGTRMLQERLPELMADSGLMKQLKVEYGIELKMKQ